jgi:proteasome lid subunit RPN8/RPN11
MVETILASDTTITQIRIPRLLWARLIFDLRRRGARQRESGAFLLGTKRLNSGRVTSYLCYDDLDPRALLSGAIAFHAVGYASLWQYCRENRLDVLADVHTHPGTDVHQSDIDQQHPMVPARGHTAMIIRNFGYTAWWSLSAVGMYEYLGNFKWTTHTLSEAPRRISLAMW